MMDPATCPASFVVVELSDGTFQAKELKLGKVKKPRYGVPRATVYEACRDAWLLVSNTAARTGRPVVFQHSIDSVLLDQAPLFPEV